MESQILKGLNQAQREAVVNYDSPSLIIAGAGSGKTRVLTSRIAYMIEQGVAPFNILALTFTNKAAEQMRERIAQMIPDNRSRYIRMGTFHSVFSRILRDNADRIGFPQSFTIYEPSDCKNLLKTTLRRLGFRENTHLYLSLAKPGPEISIGAGRRQGHFGKSGSAENDTTVLILEERKIPLRFSIGAVHLSCIVKNPRMGRTSALSIRGF